MSIAVRIPLVCLILTLGFMLTPCDTALAQRTPAEKLIAAALTRLEAMGGPGRIVDVQVGSLTMHGPAQTGGPSVYWGWVGNHLILSVNDATGLVVQHLQGGPQTLPDYLSAVPGAGDAIVMHINWAQMLQIVQGLVQMQAGEREFNIMQTLVETVGLDDVKRLTVRTGFVGPDVVSHALLETAQTRTGLLAQFKPIDLALFRSRPFTMRWSVS